MKNSNFEPELDPLQDDNKKDDTTINPQEILSSASDTEMKSPEPGLLDRVTAAFRRKQARQQQRPLRSPLLQFDSWTQPAALGVRGGGPIDRQLLYSEGQYDLDLQIVKDSDSNTFSVRGQLLESNESQQDTILEGIELNLTEPNGHQSRRITDEYGRFHFSYCSPGDYSLQVILEDHDILLKSLIVKE